MEKILLTGAGGFIGSHFLEFFAKKFHVIGIDSFEHKGTYSRISDIEIGAAKINRHDLCVPIDDILSKQIGEVDYIINLASDSAVERSITNPRHCWNNNCQLICNILEYAKQVRPKKFIQISTDEVFGNCMEDSGYSEWATIKPSNPYAASKAAQEALCIAYWRTYNMPIVIINSTNVIGERQDTEKFLPKIIQSINNDQEIPIYIDDEGKIGSRSYIDAQNLAAAVEFILTLPHNSYDKGNELPSKYNVGGDKEVDNLYLAILMGRAMKKIVKTKTIEAKSIRPGYDSRYLLNTSKLASEGFKLPWGLEETLKRIAKHVQDKPWWI